MPRAALARMVECLPGVPLSVLEWMRRRDGPGRSRDRRQAAASRKRGRILEEMAKNMGCRASTVHRRLYSTGRGGPRGRHDDKSPGMPSP
ncbi:MAG: hypothetical protein J4G04_03555 [Nitrosopumilaceae archaeon]|nr:hypothetical protein [Nitrosopumilaceae archaeon]